MSRPHLPRATLSSADPREVDDAASPSPQPYPTAYPSTPSSLPDLIPASPIFTNVLAAPFPARTTGSNSHNGHVASTPTQIVDEPAPSPSVPSSIAQDLISADTESPPAPATAPATTPAPTGLGITELINETLALMQSDPSGVTAVFGVQYSDAPPFSLGYTFTSHSNVPVLPAPTTPPPNTPAVSLDESPGNSSLSTEYSCTTWTSEDMGLILEQCERIEAREDEA